MIGAIVRAVLLIVVLVGIGAFLLGWWGSGRLRPGEGTGEPVGSTGVQTERAREVGADVGERTAAAADQARRAITDGSVTARIKGKMALDERVKMLDISVDTDGSTVTLSGVVDTTAARDRALQLARETEGVTRVVDKLQVGR